MNAALRDIERTMADHLRVSVLGSSPEALAHELMQAIGPMVIAYRGGHEEPTQENEAQA